MRVDGRRRADGERGATVIFVALLMVVLLLLLAIVVDGGALYLKRRHMVNAADAAALAAAQSCGHGDGDASARYWANRLATDNESNAENTAYSYGESDNALDPCAARTGTVTVTYQGDQPLFFGGLTGTSSDYVSATATARWGGAGAISGAVPFMLNEGQLFGTCNIPDTDIGTDCWFYFDPNNIGVSTWGELNLYSDPNDGKWGWNVQADYHCPEVNSSDMDPWINDGTAPLVSLNDQPPTYVCSVSGQKVPVFRDLEGQEGQMRYFPVNDKAGEIDTVSNGQAQVDKFDIVGFAHLQIVNVMKGTDKDWDETHCGPAVKNGWCLYAQWEGYTTTGTAGGGENFGVASVSLAG